jgi:hypothetical protein
MSDKQPPTGLEPADAITPAVETRAEPTPTAEKAAQFLAKVGGDHMFTAEEEAKVLRRIDLRVLPLLLGAYFFQQLDKSSLSYVSIFGLVEDANLVGQQYSWLGSILYFAQLVMQPAAALVLVKLPTGKVIAGAIFLWGSSLAIMAACTDFPSLLGLRFCLGAFESMIGMQFPCNVVGVANPPDTFGQHRLVLQSRRCGGAEANKLGMFFNGRGEMDN